MRKIIIQSLNSLKVQIAERKGIGHPDTLMDTLCETASDALSRHYLKRFGKVLHHNVDKGLLVAGQSKPKFGGGKILKPVEIYIAGRATTYAGGKIVDVERIIKDEARKQLKAFNLRDYKLFVKVKEGALNLKEIFEKKVAVANDTSFGVGHFPLLSSEKVAISLCNYINFRLSKQIKAIGPDVKVMVESYGRKMHVTVAIAFIDKYVKSMGDYISIKEEVRNRIEKFAGKDCHIELNTLDDVNGDESTVYLTVTGMSAEQGDDGQVGRSNRYNGVISGNMPMSLEAVSGKNVNHPGKLYQVMAQLIAERIFKSTGEGCVVKLLTQIGKPLDEPLVSVEVEGIDKRKKIEKIVNATLDDLPGIQKKIVEKV